MAVTCYLNGRLLRHHQIEPGELWVCEGKIVPPQSKADHIHDVGGLIIAPGYIDLQINGAFGVDFTSHPEQVTLVAKKLLQYGVTSFLPTVISSKQEDYPKILAQLQPQKGEGAEVLGIHLEGPHFNVEKAGAHQRSFLKSIDANFYGPLKGVRLVTLAPELPHSLELIHALRRQGIAVAAGHSLATYEQAAAAVQAGVSLGTHLFNAMGSLQPRDPGLVGYLLSHPGFAYSLIVDGIHVSPEAVKIAWKANPEGLLLVTDAIEALGLPEGSYRLGTSQLVVRGDRAMIEGTETLAGSLLTMDQAVRNLRTFTGCNLVEALEAASLKPARLLGIEKQKGTLDFGADADLLFLDDQLMIKSCCSCRAGS